MPAASRPVGLATGLRASLKHEKTSYLHTLRQVCTAQITIEKLRLNTGLKPQVLPFATPCLVVCPSRTPVPFLPSLLL